MCCTIAQLCRAISSEPRHVQINKYYLLTYLLMYRQSEKNLLNSNTSSTCPDNMVNFGVLTAEIRWQVWGTPANFNEFRVLAALLDGTLVVGVSQTLRRWTEAATYIWQGGHHVGHWPTFLVLLFFRAYSQPSQIRCLPFFYTWCGLSVNLDCMSEICCMPLTENPWPRFAFSP